MNIRRAMVWAGVCFVAMILNMSPAQAQEQAAALQYTIEKDDTLYLIATRYYGDPDAYSRIFSENRKALQAAFDRNAAPAAKTANSGQVQSQDLWPGTTILLPASFKTMGLAYEQIIYERRAYPIARDVALKIAAAKTATLGDLAEIVRKTIDPKIKRRSPEAPLGGYIQMTRDKGITQREATPVWYTAPTTDLQHCAISVCKQFESLCFFECIMVAKRMKDGDASCPPSPSQLPYEIPVKPNGDCTSWLK